MSPTDNIFKSSISQPSTKVNKEISGFSIQDLKMLLEDKPTLMDKILNFFKGAESDYADDERLSKEAKKLYRHYKKLFDQFAERNQDNNLLPDHGEAYVRGDGNENFALSDNESKITVNMSDMDRAKILKKTKVKIVEFKDDTLELSGKEIIKLKSTYKSEASKIMNTLAEKFGVFHNYSNENVELKFNYSKSSLSESIHKQNDRVIDRSHADFYDFAKMLYIFEEVVKNAQPIEAHTDKYIETKKANKNLKQVFILLSAFKDGKHIITVEFNIK